MDDNDLKIIDALEHIKANPRCNTSHDSLDIDLVKYLHSKGLIEAIYISAIQASEREYIEIKLNFAGEKHLASLKERKSALSNWQDNLLVKTLAGIIGAGIIFYLGW